MCSVLFVSSVYKQINNKMISFYGCVIITFVISLSHLSDDMVEVTLHLSYWNWYLDFVPIFHVFQGLFFAHII